ncbi:FliM/FliN family flagellar motor switch protein [Citrobacter sp. ANG330]|uniref:FliM/FliN family flagellar motor switch protein n=1 Tax=Citrobacter sp. ANG330 TaxID=3048142 RepID=UPI0039C0DD93
MKINGYSELFVEQSTFIGGGFYKPANKSMLTFRQGGGSGILWQFNWHQQILSAWCEESSWLRWVEEKYPHDSVQDGDEHLLRLAGLWTLLAVSDEMAQAEVIFADSPVQGEITPSWYPSLTLNQEGKKLEMSLVDWPADALRQFTQGWTAIKSASIQPKLNCPLILGSIKMTRRQLNECTPDTVVILPDDIDLSGKSCWLMIADIIAKLSILEDGYTVTEIINRNNETIEPFSSLSSLDDITIDISFDIGGLSLSFAEIAALKPGSTLTAVASAEKSVKLRANGCVFATGNFVMLGNTPGVRIDKLFQG